MFNFKADNLLAAYICNINFEITTIQKYKKKIASETALYLQKNFFIFEQIPLQRLEKMCSEYFKYRYLKIAGENLVTEGM
jgi:hypothetical protein